MIFQVSKLLSIRAGGITRILLLSEKCTIVSYQWNTETEQFKEYIGTSLNLGDVTQWESVSHEKRGILVVTTQQSRCSVVSAGLHVSTLDSTGTFSPLQKILGGKFTHIKLIHYEEETKTALLVVGEDGKSLNIFSWNESRLEFTLELETQLSSHAERFEATPHLNGVAILYHCDSAVHMQYYEWTTGDLMSLGDVKFLAVNGSLESPMLLFDSHETLYGILQSRNSLDSITQPECSLQVNCLFSCL